MNDLKRNGSGYYDPTAYKAIVEVEEEKKVKKLVTTILYICNLAGFHVEGRIVLKDKKTGKIWR